MWSTELPLIGHRTTMELPNSAVRCLAPLLHIWVEPGLYLGLEIGHPEFFVVFLSPSMQGP